MTETQTSNKITRVLKPHEIESRMSRSVRDIDLDELPSGARGRDLFDARGATGSAAAPDDEKRYTEADVERIKKSLTSACDRRVEEAEARIAAERERLSRDLDDNLDMLRAAVDELASSVARDRQVFFEAAQPLLVEIACSVARAVCERPLSDEDLGTMASTLSWAVERIAGEGAIDIHVADGTHARLESAGLLPKDQPGVTRWHRSSEAAEGEFVVLSSASAIRYVKAEAYERAVRIVTGETKTGEAPTGEAKTGETIAGAGPGTEDAG